MNDVSACPYRPAAMSASAGSFAATGPDGKMLDNLVHFCRALREAGLPVGPGQISEAVRALLAAGVLDRRDFYWVLHACLVSRVGHMQVFGQLFRLFWRDPRYHEHMMSLLLPSMRGVSPERQAEAAARRAAEALLGTAPETGSSGQDDPDGEVEFAWDASETVSGRERLQTLDFEQMSNSEMAEANRLLAGFSLPVAPVRSRRRLGDRRGRLVDWRATMRAAIRQGGEIRSMARQGRRQRWPSLVAICDISGSMSVYSRTVLRFLHAVAGRRGDGWSRVHAFTLGTRLTNITRQMQIGDVDTALAAAGNEARDWDGGTRIGECIARFNRDWSRRVMGHGALVLLITDGLDSGPADLLAAEMSRLRRSARRLIWINPLLRWDGFQPKATGIAGMLPHVDCFRSAHNMNALAELADAVSRSDDDGEKSRMMNALRMGAPGHDRHPGRRIDGGLSAPAIA